VSVLSAVIVSRSVSVNIEVFFVAMVITLLRWREVFSASYGPDRFLPPIHSNVLQSIIIGFDKQSSDSILIMGETP
jgi:hypothetical protein